MLLARDEAPDGCRRSGQEGRQAAAYAPELTPDPLSVGGGDVPDGGFGGKRVFSDKPRLLAGDGAECWTASALRGTAGLPTRPVLDHSGLVRRASREDFRFGLQHPGRRAGRVPGAGTGGLRQSVVDERRVGISLVAGGMVLEGGRVTGTLNLPPQQQLDNRRISEVSLQLKEVPCRQPAPSIVRATRLVWVIGRSHEVPPAGVRGKRTLLRGLLRSLRLTRCSPGDGALQRTDVWLLARPLGPYRAFAHLKFRSRSFVVPGAPCLDQREPCEGNEVGPDGQPKGPGLVPIGSSNVVPRTARRAARPAWCAGSASPACRGAKVSQSSGPVVTVVQSA